MKKVDAERFGRWLKDPVTRMYMEALEDFQKELMTECGNGGCIGKPLPMTEMYSFYQGAISSMRQAADPHRVMSDAIKEEAKDE